MHSNMGFNAQLDDNNNNNNNNNNIYKLAPIQHNPIKFTTNKKLPTKRALFFSSNDAKMQQAGRSDKTTTESSLVTTDEIRNYSLMGDYENNLGYYFSNDSTSSANGTESVPKYIHYEETYSSDSVALSTTSDTDLLCSEVLDEDDNVLVQQAQPSHLQSVKRKLFDYLPGQQQQQQQQALPSFTRQCLLVIDDMDLMCKEQLESNLRSSPTNEGISELLLLYTDENIQSTTTVYSGTVVREKAKTKRKLF